MIKKQRICQAEMEMSQPFNFKQVRLNPGSHFALPLDRIGSRRTFTWFILHILANGTFLV